MKKNIDYEYNLNGNFRLDPFIALGDLAYLNDFKKLTIFFLV